MLEAYITCLILGFVLLGAELYVPGGILGVLGGLALLAAIIIGFNVDAFGTQGAMISTLIILATVVAGLFFWVRFFPETAMGRRLSLSSTAAYKADNKENRELTGSEGVAINNLRPSGIGRINDKRIDVVANGTWIKSGARIKVVDVSGNRVLVRELPEEASKPA